MRCAPPRTGYSCSLCAASVLNGDGTLTSAERATDTSVVDDEDLLRSALVRYLEQRGYSVKAARTGEEALEQLRQGQTSLMLLDIRMPGMSGTDVVVEALDIDPDLAILMLSVMTDATSAAICMQRGAVDYLTKPIELSDLSKAVDRALRRRHTMLESRHISTWLREEVASRSAELERERAKLEQINVATLEALINALEAKDQFQTGHSARVAAFSATIANELGLSDDEIEQTRMAGRLHDLGKIGVPQPAPAATQPSCSTRRTPLRSDGCRS